MNLCGFKIRSFFVKCIIALICQFVHGSMHIVANNKLNKKKLKKIVIIIINRPVGRALTCLSMEWEV